MTSEQKKQHADLTAQIAAHDAAASAAFKTARKHAKAATQLSKKLNKLDEKVCASSGVQIAEATADPTRLPIDSPWHVLVDKPSPHPQPRDWPAVVQALEAPIGVEGEVH